MGFVLQLGYTAAISRLLPPKAFGLVALASVLLRFGSHFAQLGIASALIQQEDVGEEDVRTAFTSSVVLGVITFLLFWIAAPWLGRGFNSPDVVPVARALAGTFALGAMGTVAGALLRRQLRFRALALSEIATFAVAFPGIGVALAVSGAGTTSLIAAMLSQSALLSLALYLLVRHPVRPMLDWVRVRRLYSFGGRVSMIGFLEFVNGSADTLAVGRFLGEAALGQYTRATLLVAVPAQQAATGLTRVIFPAISRIHRDRSRVGRAYTAGMTLLSAAILPACVWLAVMAVPLVEVLLGDQWDTAAAILPLVAAATALETLTHLPAVLMEAMGGLMKKLMLELLHLVSIIVLVGLAISGGSGIRTLAAAWIGAELIRHVFYLLLMKHELGSGSADVLRGYGESLLLSGVVAVAAVSATRSIEAGSLIEVILGGIAALIAYGLALWLCPGLAVRAEIQHRGLVRAFLRRGSPSRE